MTAELIEKEHIIDFTIIHAEEDHSIELQNKLAAAQRLGNEFKSKAEITFNTTEGPKKVETTVWSVTEKYIQLKNNVHIPLNCLLDIEF